MAIDSTAPPRAGGLSTALNVIVSPREAFETLRDAPMWGWAFIIVTALMLIGTILQLPAQHHAAVGMMQGMIAHNPMFANLPDSKKAEMLANAAHPNAIQQVIGLIVVPLVILFVGIINTVILLVGNALGSGKATFKQLWASVINAFIVSLGIGTLVVALIVMMRGPDSFNNPGDIAAAWPGLGYFAPHAGAATTAFLSGINVFTVWYAYLIALAMMVVARTSKAIAYSFSALLLFLGAIIPALFANMFAR